MKSLNAMVVGLVVFGAGAGCVDDEPACGRQGMDREGRCIADVDATRALEVASPATDAIVAPPRVGTPAPCLLGGNAMYFHGVNDWIYIGTQTITSAQWNTNASTSFVHVGLTPTNKSQGLWWDVYFDTSKLGYPLEITTYDHAQRWPFQAADHPGLSLSGDGRGCNTLTGRFQIEELEVENNVLKRFTATYEQHCEGLAGFVEGCVHIEQ